MTIKNIIMEKDEIDIELTGKIIKNPEVTIEVSFQDLLDKIIEKNLYWRTEALKDILTSVVDDDLLTGKDRQALKEFLIKQTAKIID